MRASSFSLYRWRIYDTLSPWKKRGGGWRELTWEMTEADAANWAAKEGFERIEKVPGAGKVYQDLDGRQGFETV